MKTHHLKTLPKYWNDIRDGLKTFEVRRDDRGFEEGDELALVHTEHKSVIFRKVMYILRGGQFGIKAGYVVMGFEP